MDEEEGVGGGEHSIRKHSLPLQISREVGAIMLIYQHLMYISAVSPRSYSNTSLQWISVAFESPRCVHFCMESHIHYTMGLTEL